MQQLQITYMQEVIFRLNDYFFYQLIYAATDANPYSDFIARLKEEVDPFSVKGPNAADHSNASSSEESGGRSSRSFSDLKSKESLHKVSDKEEQPGEDEYYSSSDGGRPESQEQMEIQSEEEAEAKIPDENDYQKIGSSKGGFEFTT